MGAFTNHTNVHALARGTVDGEERIGLTFDAANCFLTSELPLLSGIADVRDVLMRTRRSCWVAILKTTTD